MSKEREDMIYASFSERDKHWPTCRCGHVAQDHDAQGACPNLRGFFYTPLAPLTEKQQLLQAARKQTRMEQVVSAQVQQQARHASENMPAPGTIAHNMVGVINQFYEGAITWSEMLGWVLTHLPAPCDDPTKDMIYGPVYTAVRTTRILERLTYSHAQDELQRIIDMELE